LGLPEHDQEGLAHGFPLGVPGRDVGQTGLQLDPVIAELERDLLLDWPRARAIHADFRGPKFTYNLDTSTQCFPLKSLAHCR
jgi:hypothetical protein